MRKEDRIACRGRENRHVTRHLVAVYGLPAADIDVHRAVRCIFQSIVVIQVAWIWSRDPTETKRDVLRGHGLKDGGTERGDTQSFKYRIALVEAYLPISQARRLDTRKAHRIGERAAAPGVGRGNAPITAPIPIRVGEGVVA